MCDSKTKLTIFFLLFLLFNFYNSFAESYPYDKNQKDPLSPLIDNYGIILIPKETDIAGMVINGIIYSDDDPVTIINGEVLRLNDSIGDFIISEIDKEKVVLKKGNEVFTLELKEE